MRPLLAVALLLLTPSLVAGTLPTPPVTAERQPIATPTPRETNVGFKSPVASDGETFLAVWSDSLSDVVGRSFDRQGRPLDAAPFSVHATWRDDGAVVVWDGANYVTYATGDRMSAYAARVSLDGEISSSREIAPWDAHPILEFASNTAYYATALKTDEWWSFVLIDRDFTIRKHVPLVPFDQDVRESTKVASDGTGFLVVWERQVDATLEIHAQRFDSEGSATGAPQLLVAVPRATYRGAALAANDSGYLLVWSDGASISGLEIERATAGRPFLIATAVDANQPSIAWDGRVHIVLWGTAEGRAAAVVASSGEIIRSFAVDQQPSSFWWRPTAAGNGEVFLVLWGGERYVIDATAPSPVVEHDPTPGNAFVRQETPVLAPGTTAMLAAWNEHGAVYVNRIGRDGARLDGAGIHLADVPSIRQIEVGASGDTWLVVWSTDTQVRGARVTSAGEVLDPSGFDIGLGDTPVVAGNGIDFRVVWQAPVTHDVYAVTNVDIARIPRSGPAEVEMSSRVLLSPYQQVPEALLATAAGDYVLVYRQHKALSCRPFYCPLRAFDHVLARFDRDSLAVASQRTVLFDSIVGVSAAINDDRVVLAYPTLETVSTLLTDLDGVALAAPSVLPIPPPYALSIVSTLRGYALVADDTLVQLDPQGVPRTAGVELLNGDDDPRVNDIAFFSGALWVAYTAKWLPAPLAHSFTLPRAYLARIGNRVRAVGR